MVGLCKCFRRTEKMQSDLLALDRTEFDRFKLTVEQCKKTIEDFEDALSHLNPMHDDFGRRLVLFYEAAPAEVRDRVLLDTNAVTRIKESFKEAKEEYFTLKEQLHRVYQELLLVGLNLDQRDLAYSEKIHYDKKLEAMKSNDKLMGTKKMDRNLKKRATASNQWIELDAMTSKELKRIMDSRFATIEEIVSMHVLHLRKYFLLIHSKLTSPLPGLAVPESTEETGGNKSGTALSNSASINAPNPSELNNGPVVEPSTSS